jgi:chaperonin cofactor prefoldin
MAKGGKDEHRMLFDIRGKRRNVVKVVYGVLALLMGLSLLLVAGPLPFGDIFGAQDSASEAREQFEEKAEGLETKLRKDPGNPDYLLALTRTRVDAGNSLAEVNPQTGETAITVEGRQQYEQASSVWSEYLKATKEPPPGAAQEMALTLFSLAQTSQSSAEAEANIEAAAEAQAILAKARPSIGSLSTQALYTLYTFDYAAAEQALDEAKKFATSKFQREQLENQFDEIRKQAKAFEKQLEEEKQLEKAVQEGQGGGGQSGGGQPLQNPFGSGIGGTTLSE